MQECYKTILSNVAYTRLRTKENFKLLALKVVTVDYERCPLTRGSKCSDSARKLLVFWKTITEETGSLSLREVVATGGSTQCR